MILDRQGEPIGPRPNHLVSGKPFKALLAMCKHMLELKTMHEKADPAVRAELEPIMAECAAQIRTLQATRDAAKSRRRSRRRRR